MGIIFINFIPMVHILGVDLDEVLSESLEEVLKFHDYKLKGIPITRVDLTKYCLWELPKYNVTVDEGVKYFFDVLKSDIHDSIQPVAGSQKTLKKLKEKGWRIIVITARIEELKPTTLSWLNKHFDGLFDDVVFVNHFTEKSQSKSEICKELGIEIMIEDNLEYGIELAQAGIKVYLLDRPWNQHYDPKIHVGITKIFSWEELNI